MTKHLLIQNKGKVSLLIRYADRYLIVAADKNLTAQREERLLSGGCSEAVLNEMGLKYQTIPVDELQGVAIGGAGAGDSLTLRTRTGQQKYVLSDDYSQADIDAVFSGAERFEAPGKKTSAPVKEDWRAASQQEAMWKILSPLSFVLNAAGIIGMMATIPERTREAGLLVCLIVFAITLTVYLRFPQYYTLMDKKHYRQEGYTARVKHLELALVAPGMGLATQIREYCILNWWAVIIPALIVGGVIAAVLWVRSREVRESGNVLVVVILACVLFGLGILVSGNHYLNPGAWTPKIYTVVDMDETVRSKGADSYYCVVEIEQGREVQIPVDLAVYRQLQPGDTVRVYCGTGAFGIAYAYYAGLE